MMTSTNIKRILGAIMAVAAAAKFIVYIPEELSSLLGQILACVPAVLAALYYVFWQHKPRARHLVSALFVFASIVSLILFAFLAFIFISGAAEIELFMYYASSELTVYAIYTVLFGICAANMIEGNRFRAAAVTCLAVIVLNSSVLIFTSDDPLGTAMSALYYGCFTACILLTPVPEKQSRQNRIAVIAAAFILVAGAILLLVYNADDAYLSFSARNYTYGAIASLNTVGQLMIVAHILCMFKNLRGRLLLPIGLTILCIKSVINVAIVVSNDFYGDIGCQFMLVEPIACALCAAGYLSRRSLRSAGATLMALLAVYSVLSAANSIISYAQFNVFAGETDIFDKFIYYAVTCITPIWRAALAFYISQTDDARLKLPRIKKQYDLTPSTIENDLAELKAQFENGELTETEYATLRAERLERL